MSSEGIAGARELRQRVALTAGGTAGLRGVRWISIPFSKDERGVLTVVEGDLVGFQIQRIFYMHQVPHGVERGGHAHPLTDQVLVAVAGRMCVDASDGVGTQTFLLDDPNRGLFLPRMTWTRLYGFSADNVTLAICNTTYDPPAVIRDWNEFLSTARSAT